MASESAIEMLRQDCGDRHRAAPERAQGSRRGPMLDHPDAERPVFYEKSFR